MKKRMSKYCRRLLTPVIAAAVVFGLWPQSGARAAVTAAVSAEQELRAAITAAGAGDMVIKLSAYISNTVQTGDNSNLWLYIVLMLVALIGIALTVIINKRKK